MTHIHDHLANLTPDQPMRPDFWVLEYMWDYQLISKEDYDHARGYTERPFLEGLLVDGEHETPEMKIKKERHSQIPHDLRKEERDWKRSRPKEKSKKNERRRRDTEQAIRIRQIDQH